MKTKSHQERGFHHLLSGTIYIMIYLAVLILFVVPLLLLLIHNLVVGPVKIAQRKFRSRAEDERMPYFKFTTRYISN